MKIHFESKVAKDVGMGRAVMLENLNYWILKNKANNKKASLSIELTKLKAEATK